MAISSTYLDVYFLILEEEGFEYMCCLHAFISRQRSTTGHYLAHVLEPESEEIIFFDCAEEIDILRTQLDYIISLAGELVVCYRGESIPIFEWYHPC